MNPERSGMASELSEKQSFEHNANGAPPAQVSNDLDRITSVPNPFATPNANTPIGGTPQGPSRNQSRELQRSDVASGRASSTGVNPPAGQKYFRSRRVKKGEVERPWLERKDPKEKWVTIIPIIGLVLGLIVSGILIWDGLRSVVNHKYCPVLDEDFSSWNDKVWSKEVEVGGYG